VALSDTHLLPREWLQRMVILLIPELLFCGHALKVLQNRGTFCGDTLKVLQSTQRANIDRASTF
jgi:hypothetical protein